MSRPRRHRDELAAEEVRTGGRDADVGERPRGQPHAGEVDELVLPGACARDRLVALARSLDEDLLDAADIMEFEQVAIVDVDNGARLETYTIAGPRGSGVVCLNGAAARLVSPGDKVIMISYADYEQAELADYQPVVVHVDTENRQIDEVTAELLAEQQRGPAPHRYIEVSPS